MKPTPMIQSMVQTYLTLGWKLCPIAPGTKSPSGGAWNRLENAITTPPSDGSGVGLLHAYSGTCALDIDDVESATTLLARHGVDLRHLLEAPDAVTIESGNPGHRKLLYRMTLPMPTKRVVECGRTSFELRCASGNNLSVQDVLPSAGLHPTTGQPYRWGGRGHFSNLPVLPDELFKYWHSLTVTDHHHVVPMTGMVPFSINEIRNALFCIDPSCDRETWLACAMALHYAGAVSNQAEEMQALFDTWSSGSTEKYRGRIDTNNVWRSLKADNPNGIRIGTLFHHAQQHGYARPAPDITHMFSRLVDDPLTLLDSLRPTMPEPLEHLWPPLLARRAREVSQSIGCDILAPLFAGMAAACAVIDARTRLQITDDWAEPPVLWMMVLADPAAKKTPATKAMLDVLGQIEKADRPRYKQDMVRYEGLIELYNSQKKAYLKEASNIENVLDGGASVINTPMPSVGEEPAKPVPLRLTLGDVTSQKLIQMLDERQEGMLCYLDEGASWIRKVTSATSGDDRSSWTQAYESGTYSVDRIGSGSKTVDNYALAMIVNVQPAVFRTYYQGMAFDGLLQRFIPVALRPGQSRMGDPIPDFMTCRPEYEQRIMQLRTMAPVKYRLSVGAMHHWVEFQRDYQVLKRDGMLCSISDAIAGSMGKLEGTLGRITLVWHMIENPNHGEISADLMQRAIAFVKGYVIKALNYTQSVADERDTLVVSISKIILERNDPLTLSELVVAHRKQLMGNKYQQEDTVRDAMQELVKRQWVAEVMPGDDVWHINPDLAVKHAAYIREVSAARKRRLEG